MCSFAVRSFVWLFVLFVVVDIAVAADVVVDVDVASPLQSELAAVIFIFF